MTSFIGHPNGATPRTFPAVPGTIRTTGAPWSILKAGAINDSTAAGAINDSTAEAAAF